MIPALSGLTEEALQARKQRFEKNQFILTAGDPAASIGVVLSGNIQVLKEDYWGRRSILAQLGPGDLFAEAFFYAGVPEMPVSVLAVAPTEILFLTKEEANAPQVLQAMVRVMANKNIRLTQKIAHISQSTTREKLLSYFSEQAQQAHSNTFSIPFNRQALADYLSVDRSAMSAELGKLQKEGVLQFHKSHFVLLEQEKRR